MKTAKKKDNRENRAMKALPEGERVVQAESLIEDIDLAQRPKALQDFIGQPSVVRQLEIALYSAKARDEPIDHVLFTGPPGLGKTTLAEIIASEMQFSFHSAMAPSIGRPGDLAGILVNLPSNSVLFIDEIHRLSKVCAEMLYTAMEDRHINVVAGEGSQAQAIRISIEPFTLVGATTRPGLLPPPMRDRFGLSLRLDFYDESDLHAIVARSSEMLGVGGEVEAWKSIARCGRGTPRIAKRLLRRVRDYATAQQQPITLGLVEDTLKELGIERDGLDVMDRRYMTVLAKDYRGGPAGVNALAAALHDDPDMLEEAIEPFLMKSGYVKRTPQGRMLTEAGFRRIRQIL